MMGFGWQVRSCSIKPSDTALVVGAAVAWGAILVVVGALRHQGLGRVDRCQLESGEGQQWQMIWRIQGMGSSKTWGQQFCNGSVLHSTFVQNATTSLGVAPLFILFFDPHRFCLYYINHMAIDRQYICLYAVCFTLLRYHFLTSILTPRLLPVQEYL